MAPPPSTWGVEFRAVYAQEVRTLRSWSRFATRCLKLRGTVAESGSGKRARKNLPGKNLTQAELYRTGVGVEPVAGWYPFSDTEEEVAAMEPKHRNLHTRCRKLMGGWMDDDGRWMGGDHSNDSLQDDFLIDSTCTNDNLIDSCFKAAVGRLLPGHASDFEFHVVPDFKAWETEIAYILWTPCKVDGGMGRDRRFLKIPYGNAVTAMPALNDAERASVNASFAVLVDRLGLTAVGEPGVKLVTSEQD